MEKNEDLRLRRLEEAVILLAEQYRITENFPIQAMDSDSRRMAAQQRRVLEIAEEIRAERA